MTGRTHKQKNAQKGVGQTSTDRYADKGANRDNPDSKNTDAGRTYDSEVPMNQPNSVETSGPNMVNSIIYGPMWVGTDLGNVLTGKLGVSQIEGTNLVGAAVNVGATGYAYNYFMGNTPADTTGFIIVGVSQLIFGMLNMKQ